ncbi:hypothetical protein BDBG_04313 [Blastomyces gilchristii SLH14081]|uniref:U6 snRNA phosphodiesterase n=1 Tax=Blastomyces gilchristii (strain SLH14081) TaxID=559298 RepID=A0A179UMV5_BLAGS|nr:uncharacterized protein BDBG_04313 [Blastomyces gilchristii SLH14081]OAT08351.1 hypothetical protein BDBG_04313 [Blastomyces gilchristii SLH14081]
MSLVKYSDSESEETNPVSRSNSVATKLSKRPLKQQRTDKTIPGSDDGDGRGGNTIALPPLPSEFLDLYASNSRISVQDDPSLHDGRKRVMPHVPGNWPTHIYLEWYPAAAEIAILAEVIARCGQKLENGLKVHGLLYSDLGAQAPLHISLSRPVVLVKEDRQPFRDLLNDALRESDIRPFHVKTDGLDWVSNFEKTRWFLVLRVMKPANNELNRLLAISNRSLAAFQQPPLYQTPAPAYTRASDRNTEKPPKQRSTTSSVAVADYSDYFHISIAWSLTEPSREDKERVASVELDKVKKIGIPFGSVKLKIGNIVHNLELPTGVLDEGGFCGL